MTTSSTSPSALLKALTALDNAIATFEVAVMALGVIAMALNTVANVISRFVFNHSIIFAEELNSVLILLVTFAGLGYAARQGRHIRMSAFYDALSFAKRKLLMTLICGITAICLFVLAWYACEYIAKLAKRGRIMPALGIEVYLTYLWVPVGFALCGTQYLLTCYLNWRTDEIYLSTQLKESQALEH